jgi:hypothetical protein
MHVEAAFRTVEDEVLELALEIGFHLEKLEPKHLGVGDERIRPAVPNLDCLFDEVVGLRRLLGDGMDGVLEDLALTACQQKLTPRGTRLTRVSSSSGSISSGTRDPPPQSDTRGPSE